MGTRAAFDGKDILPCRKEEPQCLLSCLRCRYRKDSGRDYVSLKVACSAVRLNRSRAAREPAHFPGASGSTSMPDSSVLVAGVVIGVVLFLSCMAIIISSLQKKGCFPQLQLNTDSTYTPDCLYSGSTRELRPACTEELPSGFYFGSCVDTRLSITHPDSPPRYDECVGPGATQDSAATDDPPPPYSLIDPCRWDADESPRATTGGGVAGLQEEAQPIPSVSWLMSFPAEEAPPYESVVNGQVSPLPLLPLDTQKEPTGKSPTAGV